MLLALAWLDAHIRYRLEDRQWQLPARVYAKPLILQSHQALSVQELKRELQWRGYQRSDQAALPPGHYRQQGNQFAIALRDSARATPKSPRNITVRINNRRITALRNQALSLPSARLEALEIGSLYPRHGEDRLLVNVGEVPNSLKEILLQVEDRHFYQHFGLSPRAIARAFAANIKAGRAVQGGSTLTQQLVKNVFFSNRRSIGRKLLEAVMAPLVELRFSKDEILELYLNEVYLGQQGARAIHGFALASQHYFNRSLAELSIDQVALLVAMVKGPSLYDPRRNPQRALERRNLVLRLIADAGLLSPAQAQQLAGQPLGLSSKQQRARAYPAYLDLVRRQLRRDYSDKHLQQGGMKIHTAFDPHIQYYAERSVDQILAGQDNSLQAAMVVTDVNSGDIVAVVGGRQRGFAGFNRALDAIRPIGSLIKPAVYLAALQQPQQYTLASRISDGPVQVSGQDGSLWQPKNFDRRSHGEVLLHRALAQSYNQATARLGMAMGLKPVIDTIKQLGVQRPVAALPSLLLGSVELSPLEVAAMYQTIAAKGLISPLRSIVGIADQHNQPIARYPLRQQQALEPAFVHLLHYAMVEVVKDGTGKAVYQQLPADYRVAGKTGTTNGLRDSWFAGFAGDYLAVVWIGKDDNSSTGLTGSSGALKIWREFIAQASHRPLDYSPPPGISYHWIDQATGLRSGESCEGARYLPFIQGSAPAQKSRCVRTAPSLWRWFRNLF